MRLGGLSKLNALTGGRGRNSSVPPIGVDFGVASMKVLQIGSGAKPALVAAAELETPEDFRSDHATRLVFQLEALPQLIAKGGFKGNRLVAAIPAAQTLCKPLRIQRSDGISLNALVQGALAVQLGCDLDQIVYRFVEVGEAPGESGGSRTEVICFATSRRLVDRIIQGCRAAKLEPVGIQNQYAANAWALKAIHADEGANLCIDLGCGSTKIVITHDNRIVFAKNIDVGGMHLDSTIARQLDVGLAQAHARRLQMDELVGNAAPSYRADVLADEAAESGSGFALLSAALRRDGVEADDTRSTVTQVGPGGGIDLGEPLEILTDEIGMCLRYHQSAFSDHRIEQAMFVGGESSHTALCQHVAKAIRIPAKVVNPLACITRTGAEPTGGVDTGEPLPGWSVALGLCVSPTDL